jgi:hypothetical protein
MGFLFLPHWTVVKILETAQCRPTWLTRQGQQMTLSLGRDCSISLSLVQRRHSMNVLRMSEWLKGASGAVNGLKAWAHPFTTQRLSIRPVPGIVLGPSQWAEGCRTASRLGRQTYGR